MWNPNPNRYKARCLFCGKWCIDGVCWQCAKKAKYETPTQPRINDLPEWYTIERERKIEELAARVELGLPLKE